MNIIKGKPVVMHWMWVELLCLIDRVTFETLKQEVVSDVRVWRESAKEEESHVVYSQCRRKDHWSSEKQVVVKTEQDHLCKALGTWNRMRMNIGQVLTQSNWYSLLRKAYCLPHTTAQKTGTDKSDNFLMIRAGILTPESAICTILLSWAGAWEDKVGYSVIQ